MMYRVASVSGNQGWDSFLLMLALISVNLGLINLLPIPMLDGGHLLVFAIEGALRRPLAAKTRVRIQQAGLVVIGLIVDPRGAQRRHAVLPREGPRHR